MSRLIPRIREFPDDDRFWRVDWFGGLERNHQVPTEPKIQIIISPVVPGATDYASTNAVSDKDRQTITIGVGQLPLVSIGSLWQNRRCLIDHAGKSRTFNNLAINPDTVQLVRSDAEVDGDQLIRRAFHRIGAGLAANCLAIKYQGDPYGLIIPVAEIIRFYYAISTDLAKAIFSGDFRHDLGAIVNPEGCDFDANEKRCTLKLRKNFADTDAYIIARILCSTDAFLGASLVHDSMIKQAAQNRPRVYPEAVFPFIGTTTLRARVKPMRKPDDSGWRNIVFALEYCTAPFPFSAITCDRDNSNLRANEETDLPDEEKRPAFPVDRQPRPRVTDGELQSDQEPSKNIQSAVITNTEDRFGALTGLSLEKPEKEMCQYISAGTTRLPGVPNDIFGTGDGDYTENDVTPASVETDTARQQPLPASFENFEAMVRSLNSLPAYQSSMRPRSDANAYIPLTKRSGSRQWSYLDSTWGERRIVVIADVTHGQQVFSLIEFQWRDGESFKLAIVSLPNGARINDDLMRILLQALAKNEGRWENISSLPEKMRLSTLKHTWPSLDVYVHAVKAKLSG